MSIDLKGQSFCAVAANIVLKVSLEQIGESLLLCQFYSNLRAARRAFGCKPSGVLVIDNTHLKDIHF